MSEEERIEQEEKLLNEVDEFCIEKFSNMTTTL